MSTVQADLPARIIARVQEVLVSRSHGPAPDTRVIETCPDLRGLGLDSLGSVNLMLALEAEFDVFIPQDRMKPQNFRSVAAILSLISDISKAA